MAFTFVDPNVIPEDEIAGDGLSPGGQLFAATDNVAFMEALMAYDLVANNPASGAQRYWNPA